MCVRSVLSRLVTCEESRIFSLHVFILHKPITQGCVTALCVCVCVSSVLSDSFVTLWTATHQASLSLEFSRQEYWGGLPFLPPGDLPNPEIKTASLASPKLAGGLFVNCKVKDSDMGRMW